MKKKIIVGIIASTIVAVSLYAENSVVKNVTAHKPTQAQLDVLSKYVLANDPALDFQEFQIENTKLDLETQKAGWLPTVDFTGSYAKETINNIDTKSNTHMDAKDYTIDVKQLVYDFKIDHSINKSKLDLQKSAFALQQKEQAVLYRSVASYFGVIKAYRQVLNSQKVQKSIYDQVIAEQKKIKSGAGSKTDLLQAQAVYQKNLAATNSAKTTLMNAINMYYRNFKTQPVDISKMSLPVVPYDKLPKQLADATKIAFENNPSLQIDEIELKKLSYDKKIDEAKFFPKIELSAKAQQKDNVSGTADQKEEFTLKAELTYNLYNGGKDSISMKKNKLKRLQQKAKIQDLQNAHKEKVAFAWQNHIMKKTNHSYSQKQVEYYQEYLNKITKQWKLGKASMFNVLDAETKYYLALNTEVSADIDKQVSVYSLLMELGQLDIEDINMPKVLVK